MLADDASSADASLAAWRAQPVRERWTRYASDEWRDVRLATPVRRVALLAVFPLVGGRLVAWPLLRAGWFVAALLVIRYPGRPGTSHGSARWAPARELRGRRPRPGCADLVIGRVGRKSVAVREAEQYEHLLLVAPTGAGKTSGLILPNLLREPGTRSLVVTDPKRELLRLTSSYLRAVYGEGSVLALDVLDPALSAGYNPLAQVTDAASADLFAQTWVRNTGTPKEPFWYNAARMLLGATALHLVTADAGVVPPLSSLLDFLCGQPVEAVTEALAESPVPEARRLARGFLTNMAKNERLVGSVFAELPPRFACLNLESVRRVTSVNEVDPARLARVPTVVYLALDLDHARTLARGGAAAGRAWVRVRGDRQSRLFLPINKCGRICGNRLSDHAFYAVLGKRLAEAGVARLSPHDLRRTRLGDLLDAGIDLATVQRLAGHASPPTTARYDRRDEATKRRAVEALHFP